MSSESASCFRTHPGRSRLDLSRLRLTLGHARPRAREVSERKGSYRPKMSRVAYPWIVVFWRDGGRLLWSWVDPVPDIRPNPPCLAHPKLDAVGPAGHGCGPTSSSSAQFRRWDGGVRPRADYGWHDEGVAGDARLRLLWRCPHYRRQCSIPIPVLGGIGLGSGTSSHARSGAGAIPDMIKDASGLCTLLAAPSHFSVHVAYCPYHLCLQLIEMFGPLCLQSSGLPIAGSPNSWAPAS